MEPQHSILDSLNPVYFAGITQDLNAHRDLFKKTARLEEVQLETHSLMLNIFIIPKKFDASQITASSLPLLKPINLNLNQMKA